MIEQIEQVLQEALAAIGAADTPEALNAVRIQYLGKKGSIQALMTKMKDLPKEEKPAFGQKVNGLKTAVSEQLEARQAALKEAVQKTRMAAEAIDITLPGTKLEAGTTHPLIMIQQELESLFVGMGYKIAEGPEVEEDYYNFELANIPQDHPARDMQDTFYIDPRTLLRTHTTAMQMREMEKA